MKIHNITRAGARVLGTVLMASIFTLGCSSKESDETSVAPATTKATSGDEAAAVAPAMAAVMSDIVDTAVGAGQFKTLAQALTVAGLVETLKGPGPFTVFAPTDAAFAKIPADQLNAILADKALLTSILTYHVAGGRLDSGAVLGSNAIETLNGASVGISLRDGVPYVNDSKILAVDVGATNGVIHVIDTVLLPPVDTTPPALKDIVDTAVGAGQFTILAKALTEAGLIQTLKGAGPFTVFAPTDEAFGKIPADQLNAILADKALLTSILTYHVVAGRLESGAVLGSSSLATVNGASLSVSLRDGAPYVNDSKIVAVDVGASNGVIHVIDTVLLPPAPTPALKDIVDTAVGAGQFTILAKALTEAGLIATLKGPGPFTVFAPTDAAFAKIPTATLNAILADKALLTSVLTYHVVAGRLDAQAVLGSSSLTTVNGASLAISLKNGAPFVNDSAITAVDVGASNGVIHVIDTVLLPPSLCQ